MEVTTVHGEAREEALSWHVQAVEALEPKAYHFALAVTRVLRFSPADKDSHLFCLLCAHPLHRLRWSRYLA
jgi:hypothetical protein